MTLINLFNSLTLTDLQDYISTNRVEDLSLEFKTVNKPDLHRDDRKNLAIAISGFANSSGGIVVWGIEARQNSDGVDCASGINEISNLPLFMSKLNEFTGDASKPTVDGIQHKAIPIANNKGLAITLVPESESGPHMAKLGEDRYYKRSGASFYKMEHFDLEDMFGRRKKPLLRLEARVISARNEIVIGIRNEGRGTAKAPFLSFIVPPPFSLSMYGVDGNCNEGLPRLHHGGRNNKEPRFGANSNIVIHPNTTHDVTTILFQGREEDRHKGAIEIRYQIAAEDMQLFESSITVDVDNAS